MRRNLIIMALVLLSTALFAQNIETLDVTKAKNGKFTTKVNNCTIEGQVVNGLKEGTWIEYFPNNSYLPKTIVNFDKGKRNGIYLELDKTGSITKKAEYQDDMLEGQVSEWYRGGRLSKMNTYKHGVMDGPQILCYERGGNLEVAMYENGYRNGLTTWFSESGVKKMTIEYKDGQFDGLQQSFYDDGTLRKEATYKAGKLQGEVKTYAQPVKKADVKMMGKERN